MNPARPLPTHTSRRDIDLLILGAGPAGLSTALHLLQIDSSWADRMLVLEKSVHPRPKLCAGGVTRFGLQILRDLGFQLPLPLPQARIDEAQLHYVSDVVRVRGTPQLVVFHRPELDAYLAQHARLRGVNIHQSEPAQSLRVDQRGVSVASTLGEYRACVVVGADGTLGIARRSLRQPQGHARIARLLEVWQPVDSQTRQSAEHIAFFDFTPVKEHLQGYYWKFPSSVEGQPVFNCGVYDARMTTGHPRAELPRLLLHWLAESCLPTENLKPAGHPIHWFSPRARFAGPRLVLVGDAAGVDPLFGEGIAPALGYGQVAAQVIQRAFSSGDFSFRDYPQRLFTSAVGRYLLLRWAVAWWGYRLCERPSFMRPLWALGVLLARIWPTPLPLW